MDWLGPLRTLTDRRFRQLRRYANPTETVTANVTLSGREATVTCGRHQFTLRGPDGIAEAHQVVDFAAFGLAVLSMSANIEIHLDGPVSAPTAQALEDMTHAYALWGMPRVAPLRLRPATIVAPPPAPDTHHKLLCMSGGIDSTAAGVTDGRTQGFTHALLIAGADYASAETSGYRGLRERVRQICAPLDLTLVEVETDIRRLPFLWGMLHGLNLIMCLHFLAPRFAAGAFACDNTPAQDLARHPWGNNGALPGLASTPNFPISGLGGALDRVQKIKAIAAFDPDLLRLLSVCWKDVDIGGNCGACEKCVQTRLNFICAGLDESTAFPTDRPIETLLDRLTIPHKATQLRGTRIRTQEFTRYLPPGPLADALKRFEQKVHRETLRHAPYK